MSLLPPKIKFDFDYQLELQMLDQKALSAMEKVNESFMAGLPEGLLVTVPPRLTGTCPKCGSPIFSMVIKKNDFKVIHVRTCHIKCEFSQLDGPDIFDFPEV